MHGENLADASALNEFYARAVFGGGVDLITHLRAHARAGSFES